MMFEPHEGNMIFQHTFNDAWEFLRREGGTNLQTDARTSFIARADITRVGRHRNEKVIRFLQSGQEYARSYECCWGHYYNCNRTRIGMYCRALDGIIE